MFSIEVSVHLSVPCVRPFSLFLSVVLRLKPPYLCGFLWFPSGSSPTTHPVFFWIFSDFFLSFLPKRIAEKEPKRYLPCSQRTMELSQPKGNNREKKYKKKNPGRARRAHTRFSICFCFRIILFVPYRII